MRRFNQWASDKIHERFASKVTIDRATGCHVWIGALNQHGYGRIIYQGKRARAHRVAMILAGRDVGGAMVLHKCHNPKCVNPEHLYLGSHKDNMHDMAAAGSKKGARHPLCRTSESDIEWMFFQRYRLGRPVKDIAAALSLSPKYTSAVLSGEKRAHQTMQLKAEYT